MAQHKLVIAEKPSVAQSLAAVIGATVRMALADALMRCPAQHTAAKITMGKDCTIKSRTARMFT